jgi:drug/metabolite transporter (DMT)-like permease
MTPGAARAILQAHKGGDMATAVLIPSRTARQSRLLRILATPALGLALVALLFSGNFVAGRGLRGQVDPLTLNFLRWLIAFAILAPFAWKRADFAVLRREWRLILALGATGLACFHTLTYHALRSTTAANALLMLSLIPIATLLGSALLWRERPTVGQIGGTAISVVGAAVLITRGDLAGVLAHGLNAGDLWMLLGVAIWAAYTLLLRRCPADLPPLVTLAASAAAALALMAVPLALLTPTPIAALASPSVLLSVGYIAVFASVVAFLLWLRGVAQIGPARAGQFLHLMPIFGAALAFILLGEVPTAVQVAGAVLVLSGLAVFERYRPTLTREKFQ